MIHFHPDKARAFVKDDERAHWHDKALWFVRVKRDRGAATVSEAAVAGDAVPAKG